MIARIVVNKHLVRENQKHGTNNPVLSIQTSRGITYANEIQIEGPSKLIYRPEKPLSCGASVWIEAEAHQVRIIR